MICSNRNRSRLLIGCGTAALALALTVAPHRAAAQAVNADATVTTGAAIIDGPAPGLTEIDVVSPTTVIDWQPFVDGNGDALTFLPAGTTLQFRSGQLPTYAVLNRILPSANNNIAVIDGNVISRITDPATGAQVAGGFVAFYSPTGLLIGDTATFDVGSLLLTTLDASPASFDNFANGGNLNLAAAPGSTARIQINPGAQISALAENSFFAVVAADIEMFGTARVNGSHAYVAGEVVNLQVSNGLFNISIPVGTAASGEVVTLNGDVGGPSSMGAGDNHVLYAVARASQDPISMLFSGNLGFDPAQSAGIVNGEIILAANYNVFGRNVDTGSISQGIGAVFRDEFATSDVRADITLDDFTAESSVLAIGTGQVIASGNSSVDGNLLLVGRDVSAIRASGDDLFEVRGDVLIDARDYGVVSSSLQTLDAINAVGATAQIVADGAALVRIGGNALVAADAFGGADENSLTAGSAQGGLAEINVTGASFAIAGRATVSASGVGTNLDVIQTGAAARGGTARVTVSGDGAATFLQDLLVLAGGGGAASGQFGPSTVSDAFGGTALLSVTGLGIINVNGNAILNASAIAGAGNASSGGALADAGEAAVSIDGAGFINVSGGLSLDASAFGGDNAGGQGGQALGGAARAVIRVGDGTLTVVGDFIADASARGGAGTSGGDAFGGVAGANAITGTIDLQQGASADASAFGGNASQGFGGDGGIGRGGNAFFQANGSANQTAVLTIGGDAALRALGRGGDGGRSDGQATAAGRGGDGFGGDFATPNQADPTFNSGAFLLAGGDYGTISVVGAAMLDAGGFGGLGGEGLGSITGGNGGDGIGGLAQVGLALLGGPGTVGGGSATFGDLAVMADGVAGDGGREGGGDNPVGQGGNGVGGNALVSVRAGEVTINTALLRAIGVGGAGNNGGNGLGGTAGVLGGQNGSIIADEIQLDAGGGGGFSFGANGGNGMGGTVAVEGDGIAVTVNGRLLADATGQGGLALGGGRGGNGIGGEAYIGFVDAAQSGTISITGPASIVAAGRGGSSQGNFAAGDGIGGLAYIQAQGGSTITLGSALVHAFGLGGMAQQHEGGNGIGGRAELRSFGAGSRLIIQNSAPSDFGSSPGDGAVLNANGIGADTNGGDGIGGAGIGGAVGVLARGGGSIALPVDPLADPATVGAIQLTARGVGGGSSVDNGVGGIGSGGVALIEADGAGSTIIMGDTIFTVMGEGGSSLVSTSNVTGGDGFAGTRTIRILDGGEATLDLIGGVSGALGGNGSGTGNGGFASGGRNEITLNNGTLNIDGMLDLGELVRGGDGARGGDALGNGEGGGTFVEAIDSTITITVPPSGLGAFALGGSFTGGNGTSTGGNAFAGAVTFALTNTDISGGFLRIAPTAQGGNGFGPVGQGGNADSGAVRATIIDSALDLMGDSQIITVARGGDGMVRGGSAQSGPAIVTLDNSSINIQPLNSQLERLSIQSFAVAGSGNQAGDATAGLAQLRLLDSTITADFLSIESGAIASSNANGGVGGAATGGTAELVVEGGSLIEATNIGIFSNAGTSAGGTAQGGVSSLTIAAGSQAQINAARLDLVADGVGSDLATDNTAGSFSVALNGGDINVGTLRASAQGGTANPNLPRSQFVALGGSINASDALIGSATGDILIQTGQGGTIGSPGNTATTTAIDIFSQGLIEIAGDNNAAVGLSGDAINLAARNLDILAGARIGARQVAVTSLETDFTAILGGTAEGEGFTLTSDEVGRINADEFSLFVPQVRATSDPNQPDLLIRDLALVGSANNGFARFGIFAGDDLADGIVRVEGTVSYTGAGADDLLQVDAGRIEIVTPGGIRVESAAGVPGGNLRLTAQDIWVADAATISQLQASRNFAGRDAQLAVAASGSDDPLGYVRAGGVTLNIGSSLLVRNTGVPFAGGGILIGGGTLSIASSGGGQSGGGAVLDVFAYGRRQTAPGTFVVGEAFFNDVNFNRASAGSTIYLDASAFNNCIINTGVCPQPPEPPEPEAEAPPQINNPTVFEEPIYVGEPRPNGEGDDDRFGIDFPEQPEAPLISEDALLDDPVTSGGDATVYGTGPTPPAGGQ